MLDVRLLYPDSPEDDEVAACASAISALIAEENERRINATMHATAGGVSPWKRAALLEGVGRRQRNPVAIGWGSKSLLALLLALALASPALADTAPPTVPRPAMPVQIAQTLPVPQLAPDAVPTIKVGLAFGKTDARVVLPDGGVLTDVKTGDILAQLPPQSSWTISIHGSGTPQFCFAGSLPDNPAAVVYIAQRSEYRGVSYTTSAAPPTITMVPVPPDVPPRFWLPATRADAGRSYMLSPSGSSATFALGDRQYRGAVVFNPHLSGSFDLINQVGLEDYLQSVVPSEMPSSWPIEALKAQAIAARSYAMANVGKHLADGYDVKPTIEDQVYAGIGSEKPSTNQAVSDTAGEVLRYQGQIVTAYFHSASGGWTEFAENVWTRPVPYLKAVPDYDDRSPYFSWNRSVNTRAVEQALRGAGKGVGSILNMMPVARGASPRVRWLLVSGTDRTVLVSGEEARRLFGLPSTCFNVGGNGESYVFAGRGFGHGLGMSQWGAKALAESGLSAADILNYYYKDVTIERL